MNTRILLSGVAAALLVSAVATQASALTISDASGAFTVGIGSNGELFTFDEYLGFKRNSDGYDPIAPGTPRDSWGLNGNFADQAYYGSNVSSIITATANTATSTTTTDDGFLVVQNYSFVGAGNILKINTSVTNTTRNAVAALFQRDVDWDPNLTFTNNTFGPLGTFAPVVESSFFGFESPVGSDSYNFTCTGGCNEDGDLGAGIRISLGTLGAGQTARFNYFYGLNQDGQNVDDLVAQTFAAGARYIMAGQSDENGSNPGRGVQSATLAVGAVSVPEPATWAMMLLGFFGLGSMVRRRKAAIA